MSVWNDNEVKVNFLGGYNIDVSYNIKKQLLIQKSKMTGRVVSQPCKKLNGKWVLYWEDEGWLQVQTRELISKLNDVLTKST